MALRLTSAAGGASAFVGREAELQVLEALYREAASGRATVVVVEAAQGVGRTALARRFIDAVDPVHVLRAGGIETEDVLAYGLVDQLLRSVGVRPAGPAAPPPVAGGHVRLGQRLLETIETLARDGPLVVVVDDVHLADTPSVAALNFVMRRLADEPVMTLLTTAEGRPLPDALRRTIALQPSHWLRLPPLGDRDLEALATVLGVWDFDAAAARRLREHSGGNVLHARALLEELAPGSWQDRTRELPAPRSVREVVCRRVARCPDDARALIEAAAVLGVERPLEEVARLAGVADPVRALEAAAPAGLATTGDCPGAAVGFVEPLVRAAVYGALSPARRRELHLRAAQLAQDDVDGLLHRMAASPGRDAALADEAEGIARRRQGRGSWSAAAVAMRCASDLSPEPEHARDRLLEACVWMLQAGDVATVRPHLERIGTFPPTARRSLVLGHAAMLLSRPDDAERHLREAWSLVDPARDAPLAEAIAQLAAVHSVMRIDGPESVRWAERAVALVHDGSSPPSRAALVHALAYSGQAGTGLGVVQTGAAAGADARSTVPLGIARGILSVLHDDLAKARRVIADDVATALTDDSLGLAAYGLSWLARVEYRMGAWDDAARHGTRAVAIATELERSHARPAAVLAAIAVPAARGQWAVTDEYLQHAHVGAGDYEGRVATAAVAKALVASARLDAESVLDALEPLASMDPAAGIREPGLWCWEHLYAEALVALGDVDAADAFLASEEARAAERGLRSAGGVLARVRGRVQAARGDVDGAEAAFARSIADLDAVGMPFDAALTRLAYGQWLRRTRRRSVAARELRAAHDTFRALGARPYEERCAREVTASGLRPAKRNGTDRDRLTPQEQAIAELAASGRTNRHIAQELLLSVKTVENHLTRIYAKLGVASRTELAVRCTS